MEDTKVAIFAKLVVVVVVVVPDVAVGREGSGWNGNIRSLSSLSVYGRSN